MYPFHPKLPGAAPCLCPLHHASCTGVTPALVSVPGCHNVQITMSLKPFLMQFFSYMVEKSYMFLLCNGLLAVIAMNSGLVSSSSPPTTHHSPEHPAVVEAVEVVAHTEKTILPDSNESNIAVAAPISAEETESPQEKKLFCSL
ncbi:hypothetical protein VIGAN_03006200 [Vigna angularis var. angularis]|uniref:DUF4408 domain-containing protein n=1 Tax=Vigna angularis var. angularis TaxID=157739 RepID=A0A0S3RJ29_PHAAN|nr:hypothetical protein VIGAN_03006200 [Vigna angularis var. angularis]